MTTRRLLLAALASAVMGALMAAPVVRWYVLRSVDRAEAGAAARLHEAEAEVEVSRVARREAEAELATWTARAEVAEAELETLRLHRDRTLAEVRRPTPPAARARRIEAAVGGEPGDVVPSTRGGREGVWVAADRLVLLEEALVVRASLEAEVVALTRSRDAERARVDALSRVVITAHAEAETWRTALVAEQAGRRRAEADASPALPWWAWAAGGALAGAAVTAVVLR